MPPPILRAATDAAADRLAVLRSGALRPRPGTPSAADPLADSATGLPEAVLTAALHAARGDEADEVEPLGEDMLVPSSIAPPGTIRPGTRLPAVWIRAEMRRRHLMAQRDAAWAAWESAPEQAGLADAALSAWAVSIAELGLVERRAEQLRDALPDTGMQSLIDRLSSFGDRETAVRQLDARRETTELRERLRGQAERGAGGWASSDRGLLPMTWYTAALALTAARRHRRIVVSALGPQPSGALATLDRTVTSAERWLADVQASLALSPVTRRWLETGISETVLADLDRLQTAPSRAATLRER